MERFNIEDKSYMECIELLQARLKELSKKHGALKKWCIEKAFDYPLVVKLKNGTTNCNLPVLVRSLLSEFGYEIRYARITTDKGVNEHAYKIIHRAKDPFNNLVSFKV